MIDVLFAGKTSYIIGYWTVVIVIILGGLGLSIEFGKQRERKMTECDRAKHDYSILEQEVDQLAEGNQKPVLAVMDSIVKCKCETK